MREHLQPERLLVRQSVGISLSRLQLSVPFDQALATHFVSK
jgi:hypothetical protein